MLTTCGSILEGNDLCVLATQGPLAPHTSLMSYVSGPETGLEEHALSFVTLKNTAKYANIRRAPLVSVLVDTRLQHCRPEQPGGGRSTIQALTIIGRAVELQSVERQAMLSVLQAKHPQVAAICAAPDAAVIVVRVISYQLLRGALNAVHIQVREDPGMANP